MAVITPSLPAVCMPAGTTGIANTQHFYSSAHNNDGDIMILSGGLIAPAAINASGLIVGVATNDSLANYAGYATTGSGSNLNSANTLATWYGITPNFGIGDSGTVMVELFAPPASVEINLISTCGWVSGGTSQATIGTQVGINIQNGIYVVDPTQTNKVAVIKENIDSPVLGSLAFPIGAVGNLGSRVRVTFLTAALAELS